MSNVDIMIMKGFSEVQQFSKMIFNHRVTDTSSLMHIDVSSLRNYVFSVGPGRNFRKCMEVIVKIGKTNTMTNTWKRQRQKQTNKRSSDNQEKL